MSTAKNAILKAKINGVLTEVLVKTSVDSVYMGDGSTLVAKLNTLAAASDVQALQATVNALGALSKKDKVSYADLETALAALIDGKAEASALTEEINRAKAAEEAAKAAADAAKAAADAAQGAADAAQGDVDALEGRMDTVEGQIVVMVGEDAGKSIRTIANEELAAQLIGEGAKESLDTLGEIAAWIQSHPDDASAMNEAIVALQNQLKDIPAGEGTVKKYIDDAIAALNVGQYALAADLTALAGRVTTAEGKITAAEGKITELENAVNGLGDMAGKDVVSESDLDAALAEKVNAASEGNHSHSNKGVIDGITAEKVAAWDDASTKAHSHANKTVLEGITSAKVAAWDAAEQNAKTYADGLNTAMDARVKAVEGTSHTHANKTVIDGITAAQVSAWDGKGMVYAADATVDLPENVLFVQLVD